ncbi:MAG: phage portal protein [Armatimonadota bacterium]
MSKGRRTKKQNKQIANQTVKAIDLVDVAKQILNTGYSGSGASTNKNYSRGWEWKGGSPTEDISKNLDTLRQRSRDLWMNSPIARAALMRVRDNSIGIGLRLQATPNIDILGLTPEQASAWARRMEWEFGLWADSRECDALGLNTFGELQALALLSWLQSGDCFALLPMRDDGGPYELKIHLIEADRIYNPMTPPTGKRIENGVEIDSVGRTIAYWVSRQHPLTKDFTSDQGKFDRIPIKDDASGRRNILHMMVAERPEQRRGVPYLAPVIESLKQLTRYAEAELTAAVVAALFTVFIKSNTPQTPLGEAFNKDDQVSGSSPDADKQYELGPGAVMALDLDEDIQTVNPMRPNSAFDSFVMAVCREVGAALGIPYEVMLQAFTASYSASRAALLDFWKTARYWREGIVRNLCRQVYEEIAWEAVLKGRVQAPGFVDDPAIRAAWLSSEWHGPAMGQIDPLKEVMAAEKRLEVGVSTLAREAMELTGSDWETNVIQRGIEEQAKRDAGLVIDEATKLPVSNDLLMQMAMKD